MTTKKDILKKIHKLSENIAVINSIKGLLILSVPKSGSTALERACSACLEPLGFVRKGEILNKYFYPELEHYWFPEDQFHVLAKRCEAHYQCVIRDVTQQHFIVQNIEWLKTMFNILLLIRPPDQVYRCMKMEWTNEPPLQDISYVTNLQDMLLNLVDESIQIIKYHDFVFHPEFLFGILKQWYPACDTPNYITTHFKKRRNQSINK